MQYMLAYREQTEKCRLTEFLEPKVKRWSNGKEGNLRALFSTLQYILGLEFMQWLEVGSVKYLITADIVKKAYMTATLCVHPDELQQTGLQLEKKYYIVPIGCSIGMPVLDVLLSMWKVHDLDTNGEEATNCTCRSQKILGSSPSVHIHKMIYYRFKQEAKISTECVDGSGTPDPETVNPVVPRHPKSYMEVMEMIQRGERPDDIQDINDEPPNPDQPISESRMAPKPKPWEKQGQESSGLDLKAHPSDSSEPTSGVQTDRTNHGMESNNNSDHGDALLIAEPAMGGSEGPVDDDAASPEQ